MEKDAKNNNYVKAQNPYNENKDYNDVPKTAQQQFVDRIVNENKVLREKIIELSSLLDEYTKTTDELRAEKQYIIEQWGQLKSQYEQVVKGLQEEKQQYKSAKEEYFVQKREYGREYKRECSREEN